MLHVGSNCRKTYRLVATFSWIHQQRQQRQRPWPRPQPQRLSTCNTCSMRHHHHRHSSLWQAAAACGALGAPRRRGALLRLETGCRRLLQVRRESVASQL